MASIVLSVLSGVFACVVAILATIAVEKLGGVVGGCLATMPLTIVPFSIGLALSLDTTGIRDTLFAIPPTVVWTSVYLLVWRELPSVSAIARLDDRDTRQALALVALVTTVFWFAGAIGLTTGLPVLVDTGVSIQIIGVVGFVANVAIGITALYYRSRPAPGGKRPVTLVTYLSRGVLAGVVITVSMVLGGVSPTLAGVASVFPSVTGVTCLTLWWSQGRAVPQGAATSLALGNSSVAFYAIAFAFTWPSFSDSGAPLPLALTACVMLCWVLAGLLVAVPLVLFIRTRTPRSDNTSGKADGIELSAGLLDSTSTRSASSAATTSLAVIDPSSSSS